MLSTVTRPVKELKGFKKVWLKPGETQVVEIEIENNALAFYDINMDYVVEPGDFTIFVGTSSDNDDLMKLNLTVK